MSEFSDSFHLRASVDEAAAFARTLGARGIVMPEGNRWSCVVSASLEEPEDGLERRRGLAIHFAYAADHECRAQLFDGGRKVGDIRILFEGQKPRPFDPRPWIERGLLDAAGAAQVARWVERGEPGPPARRVGYRLAELLGLRHYKWLSSHDLDDRWDELLERDSGAVAIDPDGAAPRKRREDAAVAAASAGPSLAELLVEEHFVTMAGGRDASDLESGIQAILRKHPDAATRAKELLRWLRAQKTVQRVSVDVSVLEGMVEAF